MSIRVDASCAGDATLSRLASWLTKVGGYLSPKLSLFCAAEAGRHVRTIQDMQAGEVAASVPLQFLMTQEAAGKDAAFMNLSVRGTNLIALVLLGQRRKPDARWHAYASALPQQLSTTLHWTEDELSELQGAELFSLTAARKDAVARHHAALQASLDPMLSLEDFAWALSTVWARGHTVELRGSQQGALAPLIDMFNRHSRPGLKAARVEEGALVLRTARRLGAGEEATVRYGQESGQMPNSRLLLDYGFCEEGRPHEQDDFVTLQFGALEPSDPHWHLREAALRSLLPVRLGYRDASFPPLAFAAARLASSGDVHLLEEAASLPTSLPAQQQRWLQAFVDTSTGNAAALRFLFHSLRERLDGYATTAAEDSRLLLTNTCRGPASPRGA